MNNRLSLLSDIIEMVRATYNKAKGIKAIKVVQAAELPEASKADLLIWLSKKIPGKLDPLWLVDSSILGGVVIYDGDTVYDYSLRVKVEQIKKIILGK
jgi:F0F1-type ATP synthase delta subunit